MYEGQIQKSTAATDAAGSPTVRRPTRQTSAAATAKSAIGTSLSARVDDPRTANTGAVRKTSSVPP